MEINYSGVSSNNQNVNASSDQTVQNVKVQSQSQEVGGLSAGKTFRGEILEVKGSQISIGLENGLVLNARLGSEVSLSVGQKITFEVELNNGNRIEIKPVTDLLNPNPVLQKALQEANLQITQRNLDMVWNMMKEGLSIDKQSINKLLKQLNLNLDTDISTIIKMNKLGIEVSKENIQQFENYKNYEHRIVKDINYVAVHLTEMLKEVAGEDKNYLPELHNKLISILNSSENMVDLANNKVQTVNIPLNETTLGATAGNPNQMLPINGEGKVISSIQEQATQILQGSNQVPLNEDSSAIKVPQEIVKEENAGSVLTYGMTQLEEPNMSNGVLKQLDYNGSNNQVNNHSQSVLIENVLSGQERDTLAEKLKELGADNDIITQVKESKMSGKEFLNLVRTLTENPTMQWKADSLFRSNEYLEVLTRVIKEEWLIQPEDLKQPDKMNEFYNQLNHQTKQIAALMESIGKENTNVMKELSNIRSNISFMEQINQNFTYMQIPVQFSNEEAHSDLYVYTNKKNLKDKDSELSVLLHLDMEVLGTTDIYIKMTGNDVSAKFSLQDKKTVELIENNFGQLIDRLKEKGYHTTALAEIMGKEQDFVEDFLEKDRAVTSLKRYAFDVRT